MKNKFFTKTIVLSIILCSTNLLTNAQPGIKSLRTLGGGGDDNADAIISTGGNSFAVCGSTNSSNGNFNVAVGNGTDAFIAKYTSPNHIAWAKTFGGSGDDYFTNILKTNDGGFIATGSTTSNDGDVSGNHGGAQDIWVVKLNAFGNIQWQKCFGGSGDDFSYNISSTPLGYLIAGATNSTDGNVTTNQGDYDGWILKISLSGLLISQKTFGGSGYDEAVKIFANPNGTFIFSGTTGSNDGDVSGNHGGAYDTWLVKTANNGNILWSRTYGGSGDEFPNAMVRTKDGNFVIGHGSNSTDGDVDGNGNFAAWILKLNQNTGNIIWSNPFNDNGTGWAIFGLSATSDGGVIATGSEGDITDFTTMDVFILKFNSSGNKQWHGYLAGSEEDFGVGVIEKSNGNFVFIGGSYSSDGDFNHARGGSDAWVAEYGNCGNHRLTDDALVEGATVSVNPNVFSTSTTISFSLPESQNISLQIFDVNGKLVTTLASTIFEAGEHHMEFNSEKLDAGIYFLKMQAGDELRTEKLMVTK